MLQQLRNRRHSPVTLTSVSSGNFFAEVNLQGDAEKF